MEWTRGPCIGFGSSAAVSIARFHNSGEILAVKSAEFHRSETLQHEQRILSSLSCPHIVSYKGCDITRERSMLLYNLFLEYLPRGTLADEIRRHGGKLDETAIVRYGRQVMLGLDHLHSRGLVHCDVKSRNILIGEDGAKIADFGLAKRADEEAGTYCGTPAFMAPEVARKEGQSRAADVWAFGCTVIEMATGRLAWGDADDAAGSPVSVLYRIGFSGWLPEIPGNLSVQAKDFLEKCLRRNPEDRWTASQLLNHPFLTEQTSIFAPIDCSVSDSNSPTSILEIGLWSSTVTDSEFTGSCSSRGTASGGAEEPQLVRRIENLTALGRAPEWRWDDEDWITVRGNSGGGDNEHGSAGSVGKSKKLAKLGRLKAALTSRTAAEYLSIDFTLEIDTRHCCRPQF
ncbi:hypothetical protein SAY86_005626 [Trapa natans]|uniref:Protein kinase domain-containing protein n=1 Tax=Trapa natans TaxID=22666 RepID=A0AAN7KV74_TRANT|nr:hypothetical protein SAY86_005626 [Trapa natans]